MILVIDNYDSFTFNVTQLLQTVTDKEIKLVRNDEYTVEQLAEMNPKYLIVSPGPGAPYQAGVCEEAIKYFAGKIPILGICLGHQAICEAFGARIVQAKYIRHGIVEDIDLLEKRIRVNQDAISHLEDKQTQRNMYMLSVIAGIFLPLSFLASVFGMNLGGIPLATEGYGFITIVVMMVLIGLIIWYLFKRLKWI